MYQSRRTEPQISAEIRQKERGHVGLLWINRFYDAPFSSLIWIAEGVLEEERREGLWFVVSGAGCRV